MNRSLRSVLAFVVMLPAILAVSQAAGQSFINNVLPPIGPGAQFWIDADPFMAGMQAARVVPVGVGGTFSVDVIAYNVPALPQGLRYTHFWIHYDQSVVNLTGAVAPWLADPLAVGVVNPFGSLPPFGSVPGVSIPNASRIVAERPPTCCPCAGGGPSGTVTLVRLTFTVISLGQTGLEIGPGSLPSPSLTVLYRYGSPDPCGEPVLIPSDISPGKARIVVDVVNPTTPLSCLNVNRINDLPALPAALAFNSPDTVTTPVGLGIDDVTLRSAIQLANQLNLANHITFRIPGAPAPIGLTGALPALSDASGGTHIDGTTQANVVVDGAAGTAAALTITQANNIIDTITVNSTPAGAGILISGVTATGNQVRACKIGTNAAGTGAIANNVGVRIDAGANSNDIGLPAAGDGNVISGNTTNGVLITGAGSSFNRVRNNLIGLNAAGTAALPNLNNGVVINLGASGNTIGGQASGDRNAISGNIVNGIRISTTANNNFIEGNNIGTNAAALAAVPNVEAGVRIDTAATSNMIGGVNPAAANVIAGNTTDGVLITGAGTDSNEVRRNRIGSNFVVAPIPNEGHGVQIAAAAKFNLIADNTIEANGTGSLLTPNGNGVLVDGAGTDMNEVNSNFIGAVGLANKAHGVVVSGGAMKNLVTLNHIGNNDLNGIKLTDPGTDFNTITANQIIGNGLSGIEITGIPGAPGPLANSIGGSIPAAGNIITGNLLDGIRMTWGMTLFVLPGNSIARNTISFNRFDGVNVIFGVDHAIEDNSIHDNGRNGVSVSDADGSVVPGSLYIAIRRNSIHGNGALGIDLMPGGAMGVTPNDDDDGDVGPNELQNYPILTAVSGSTVSGTIDGASEAEYVIDFFGNDGCDSSSHGEGKTYLGSATVTTDSGGRGEFTAMVSGASAATVTATATDESGNTSEFSPCGIVVRPVPCPADINGNGCVNGGDIACILGLWTGAGTYPGCTVPTGPFHPADLNQDCKRNGLDIAIVLGSWGPCPGGSCPGTILPCP